MGHELGAIDNWTHDALAAKTNLNTLVGGRIWRKRAKQDAKMPYCLFGFQSGQDVQGLGTVRLSTRPLFFAKLVFKGSATSVIDTALDELDDAMGKVSVSVSGGYVISARRMSILDYDETDADNNPIFHRGGLYRLEVSESGA
jgi:hypothetical protein